MASGDELAETAAGPPAPAPRPPGSVPRPGDTVGRYVVERVLGAGGMGVVFAALDPDLDRRVALKLLRGVGDDVPAEARARLLREARAMAKLSHPNVITVYEVGSAGAIDFVAMELIEGTSAAEWLHTRRPPEEVLPVFLAAGRGLAAAHRAGLVHRDFKPANVLVGQGGKVVVTDFGLARAFDAPAAAATATASAALATSRAAALDETLAPGTTPSPASSAPTAARGDHASLSNTLTRTGAMLGTPAYMAPEQYLGGAGPRADQFSFCVAVWEALAGARPFRGQTFDELRRAIDAAVPTGDVPRAIRPVLVRGLARDPARRFDDMDALLAALDRRRWRPLGYAAVAAAAAVAGGVALMALGGGRSSSPAPMAAPAVCATGEAELASAWSPAIGDRLGAHLGDTAAARTLRARFEHVAATWRSTWAETCAHADSAAFQGRIACLLDARDDLGALATHLEGTPVDGVRGGEPDDYLTSAQGCFTGRRPALPPMPDDPALRARIAAVHRTAATAGFLAWAGRFADARATAAAAIADARRLDDYEAALAAALQTAAVIELADEEPAAAEALYREAAMVADRAAADSLRAMALLGQLEGLAVRSSDHGEIRELADKVDASIERAGNEAVVRAGLDLVRANLASREGDLDGAIAHTDAARLVFRDAPDLRRATTAAHREARYLYERNHPGDFERGVSLLRDALAQAQKALGDRHPTTDTQRRALGMMLVNTAPEEALALFAAAAGPDQPPGPGIPSATVRGRVVDPRGQPVAGATVEVGKVLMAASNGDGFPLDFGLGVAPRKVLTDAAGRFEVVAGTESIAIASMPGFRSAPALATASALELRLAPVGDLVVDVLLTPPAAGTTPEAALAARLTPIGLAVGYPNVLEYTLVPRRDAAGRWHASRLAAGVRAHLIVAVATALGDQIMTIVSLTPSAGVETRTSVELDLRGVILDVVVRADRAARIPSAQVVALPGRSAKIPTQLGPLRQRVFGGPRAMIANARRRNGADGDDGEIRARLSAIPPGAVTLCAIPFSGDLADENFLQTLMGIEDEKLDVRCQVVDVPATPAVQQVVLETPPMKRLPALPVPPVPPTPPTPSGPAELPAHPGGPPPPPPIP